MSPTDIIIAASVFSLASIVHGICGFGFGLVAVGMLSLLIDPKLAIPLDLIAASVNCFYMAWLLRKDVIWKETLLLVILTTIFIPIGTIFLRNLDRSYVIRSIGIIILFVSLISLFKLSDLKFFKYNCFKWISGVVGGLLGGAFNLPGPLLVLYAYNGVWPVRNAMANLQFIFSTMAVITLISFRTAGLLSTKIIGIGLLFVPIVIGFTLLGSFISKKLSIQQLKTAVNIMLFVLGCSLIFKA
jgi:hypothetical protein